jgi:Domain of unknown function (DUF2431)
MRVFSHMDQVSQFWNTTGRQSMSAPAATGGRIVEESTVRKSCDKDGHSIHNRDAYAPTTAESVSNSSEDESGIIYVTLGDGDFSYSADLASHFAAIVAGKALPSGSEEDDSSYRIRGAAPPCRQRIKLVATGFDSLEELMKKYTDAPFLIKKLKSYQSTSHENSESLLFIDVLHGVNAIVSNPEPARQPDFLSLEDGWPNAQRRILFHHPHLGTEDAKLHHRFICHLFHSIASYWFSPKPSATTTDSPNHANGDRNMFFMTLVHGQYDRWNVDDAARRAKLVLVDRSPFVSPPLAQSSYYQHRRHQSGRSFASRAVGGSETFVFVREDGFYAKARDTIPLSDFTRSVRLFGSARVNRQEGTETGASSTVLETSMESRSALRCNFCNREFAEARSLRNHLQCKHPEDPSSGATLAKRKRLCDGKHSAKADGAPGSSWIPLPCPRCPVASTSTESIRLFSSQQSLSDHIRAKHSLHQDLLPDWSDESKTTILSLRWEGFESSSSRSVSCGVATQSALGCCHICGFEYTAEESIAEHKSTFAPSPSGVLPVKSGTGEVESARHHTSFIQCQFCWKQFREERARRQHENMCATSEKSTPQSSFEKVAP